MYRYKFVYQVLWFSGKRPCLNWTYLSEPDPVPLLLPEEELSLLLSFSESDPDSLPDSDSNAFCKLTKPVAFNCVFYFFTKYHLSSVVWNNFPIRLSPISIIPAILISKKFYSKRKYDYDNEQKISSSQSNLCILIFSLLARTQCTRNGTRIRPPFYDSRPPFCVLANVIPIS